MTKVKSGTVSEYQKQRRDQAKLKALDYLGSRCMYCETGDGEALRFVHKDPGEKLFGISTGLTKAWETLRPELDKCVLICRDCAGRGASVTEGPAPTPAELEKASADRYTRAGEEYHAGLELEFHNARVNAGKEGVCDCDYCEDTRQGHELPEAYKLRLKDLKNWGN